MCLNHLLHFYKICVTPGGLPSGSVVKNPPAMRVQPLGWEDALEEGMATHSSILARRILRTEEPGGLQPMGRTELDMTGE